MAMIRYAHIRRILLLLFLLFVWSVMLLPGAGEWYALTIYPSLSKGLSAISSLFPFSLGDLFIYGTLLWFVVDMIRISMLRREKKWRRERSASGREPVMDICMVLYGVGIDLLPE